MLKRNATTARGRGSNNQSNNLSVIHIPLSDRRDQPPTYDASKICVNASSLASFNDKPPPSYEETIARTRTTNI